MLISFLAVFLLSVFPSLFVQAAEGKKAMAVTPDPRATQAALEILEEGGNAVDAAVAAQWVLSVVMPQATGLGGSGLFLFYDIGTRRILFFDGSAAAPAKSSADLFFDKNGGLLPYAPDRNTGGASVGVPGLLKLAEEVHAKYGTRKFPFAKLFEKAIREAEDGTEINKPLAEALKKNEQRIALTGPFPAVFSEEEGVIVQHGLAKAFRLIQAKGTDVFYKGTIAKAIEKAVRKDAYRPASLTGRALGSYSVKTRDPVHTTYQGYDLFSAGPPASGGMMLFRALHVLSRFGMSGFGQAPEMYHLLGETQKAALFNRSAVADPDFFDVPFEEVLSEAWAENHAASIKFDRVSKEGEVPKETPEESPGRDGVSVMVVDPQGNIAAISSTLGDAFGSGLFVAEYGFFLNNLLAGFSEGRISAGERPPGREAPTLVFKEGRPAVLLDAYGPSDPAALLLNILVQKIDSGASCAAAIESPRLLTRGRTLFLESGLYHQETTRLKLELLGHALEKKDPIGFAQMVCFDEGSDRIVGESDPRGGGEAAGF